MSADAPRRSKHSAGSCAIASGFGAFLGERLWPCPKSRQAKTWSPPCGGFANPVPEPDGFDSLLPFQVNGVQFTATNKKVTVRQPTSNRASATNKHWINDLGLHMFAALQPKHPSTNVCSRTPVDSIHFLFAFPGQVPSRRLTPFGCGLVGIGFVFIVTP